MSEPVDPTALAAAARLGGAPFAGGANRPISLNRPEIAWFVETGAADVFLTHSEDGVIVASPHHLLRAEAGRLLFAMSSANSQMNVVAKGTQDSRLRKIELSSLEGPDTALEVAEQVDLWVSQFAATVAARIEPRPTADRLVSSEPAPTAESEAQAGEVLSTRYGDVAWVRCEIIPADSGTGAATGEQPSPPPDAQAAYLGTEHLRPEGTGFVPLTADSWMTLRSRCRLRTCDSADLMREGLLMSALEEFHDLVRSAESLNRMLLLADQVNEQTGRSATRSRRLDHARTALHAVAAGRTAPTGQHDGSALEAALHAVGSHEGIEFGAAVKRTGEAPTVSDILYASGVRGRRVHLRAADRWWHGDSGAMLGFLRDGSVPVALVPSRLGRYRLVNPTSGHTVRLNARRAAEVERSAWSFCRPLADSVPTDLTSLFRAARGGSAADLARFVIPGLAASALAFFPAVALGMLADWVLPTAASGALSQVILALAAFALLSALFQVFGGTALMRLEGRIATRITESLWDRLLRLPAGFFSQFTAGDLTVRMSTLNSLRDRAAESVVSSLSALVFVVPTLGLLFAYDVTLALTTSALGVAALAVISLLGIRQIKPQRQRYRATRRLATDLFQFIGGIGKLRSAGAESAAFAEWAHGYREQQQARIRGERSNQHLVALGAALPATAAVVLFGVTLWRDVDQTDVGGFLLVYVASATFIAAVGGIAAAFQSVAEMLPAFEAVKPILEAVPEPRTASQAPPPTLSGDFRLDQVSFQYSAGGRQILEDVSLCARPGEFVAIVGESGAGKSTLLRLALGFEDPQAGGIYYDGRSLANLDRRSVRRAVGVVMQSATLQPGDVLDNIIGVDSELTIDDAWEAARLAAVKDDIAAMPMGMFTAVGDNSGGFSGGQVQRIKIAAALVRKPGILFLDEATNWLDAHSQSEVMDSIEGLTTTRVVIAHRISTLRKADRIYVLSAGRIVQEGRYAELLGADGPFRSLVQRQLQ